MNELTSEMEIGPMFDIIEHGYIHEKLRTWINGDLQGLANYLSNYIKTGNQEYLDYFNSGLSALASEHSSMKRELDYIKSRAGY
jgi:hypothetical protein